MGGSVEKPLDFVLHPFGEGRMQRIAANALASLNLPIGGTMLAAGAVRKAMNTVEEAKKTPEFEMPEIEMPEFSFEMPEMPPLPEPPKAPPPPPTGADAAARAEKEAAGIRGRRRVLSLFASSKNAEGRASTILTGSMGVQQQAPVRKRILGGTSVLGGQTV
jgi:hypothetical protein